MACVEAAERAGDAVPGGGPSGPDVLYAGSRGDGVWSECAAAGMARLDFPEADVFSLAVSPVDSAVYAGTEPSRLFVSRTRGDRGGS